MKILLLFAILICKPEQEIFDFLFRGDLNASGDITLSDVTILGEYLYQGHEVPCPATADFNGDGVANTTDMVNMLQWLFTADLVPEPVEVPCNP